MMSDNEFLIVLSNRISAEISNLEYADNHENPDVATKIRSDVQDRLQELVIEINEKAGI